MIPTAYEFHWDLGHIFFLGIFYLVLTVVVATLVMVARRGLIDLKNQRIAAIDWQETFHDLPRDRRQCRHAFDGTAPQRLCDRDFACADCPLHPILAAATGAQDGAVPAGLSLPTDRYYHRGHTWVEPRQDGTLAVGIDDLADCCLGAPDEIVVPPVGSDLGSGDRVATVRRGKLQTRLLSPVIGTVVATGAGEHGEFCRIRPRDPATALAPLLHGGEAEVWMLRELESLQELLGTGTTATTLADGGTLVDDLVAAYPDADWDRIWGHVCLEA